MNRRKQMNRQGFLSAALLVLAGILVMGCQGDPSIRRQRYLESGDRYSSEGKYREASLQYLNALKFDEDFPEAHYGLAQAYEHLGQFAEASNELERTVDAQPTNFRARIDLGNLLFASGRTEEARAQASVVLEGQPDNPDGHALLSAIADRQGRHDQAVLEIKRALALDPGRAVFHENLAILQAGDPARAPSVEDELKRAVALDPKSLNARLLLAAFYARNNRLAEAERVDWEAVTRDPTSITARANVAELILKEGDWARAEQVLRQASKDFSNNPQEARILADYYADTEQLYKAKSEFEGLITRYPKNASLQKGYIRVLIQLKNYAAANTQLAGLIRTNPNDPEVAAFNGILLLNNGNVNDAVTAIQDCAQLLPKDAFIQYWLGKAAQAAGDSSLSERAFREATSLNPSGREGQEEMARIAGKRGDVSLLNDVAERTIAALPRFPDGYVWRAIVEMDRNQPDRAEADLKTSIAIAPQGWQAYLQLGKLRFAQKRFAEGSTQLEQALEYNPNSVEALRRLVEYDLYQNHPDQAMSRVNAQIDRSPRNSSYYDLLADLQMQNKSFDQAEATAQKAIKLNSADGEAVMLFAQIAVQRGQTVNAISAWERWSDAHPRDAGALAVLGTLEESRGNLDIAKADYKKSLQIQPQQPIAANNLAYRMLLNGEMLDVALTLAETARQGMPDSPNTADTLAWAYYYKGTYQFARDLLEDAIRSEPDSATMHYHLGMVYSKLRDKNNAEIHLKKAVTLPHDTQIANEVRIALQGLS
jgi:tetratricopeptide (TPR) repeat protein